MNKDIMVSAGFQKEIDNINKGLCPFCGIKPDTFKNELSIKEYKISGMCQVCQDNFFKEE
jgi:uncharacterized CHY-type Zn-finger protein